MKKLWNIYGRRITALFFSLLLAFMSMPCMEWNILSVAAEETDVQGVTAYQDVTPPVISDIVLDNPDGVLSYAHGNYSNSKVVMTVTASDVADSGVVVSGIWKIRLFFGDAEEAFGEIAVPEDSVITDGTAYAFNVNLTPDITELEKLTEIKVSAVDNNGNESEKQNLFGNTNGFQSSFFMFDRCEPTVTWESTAEYEKKGADNMLLSGWYTEIPEKLVFVLSDRNEETSDGSGLLSVKVTVDGTELTAYNVDLSSEDTAGQKLKVEIPKEHISGLSNGAHQFTLAVRDFAGNETKETFVIGIDNGAPVVIKAEYQEETSGEMFDFGSFGNYHNKSVQLILTIADTADEGVKDDTTIANVGAKEATLYLDGKEYKTVQIDEDSHAIFTIPENLMENQFINYTKVTVTTKDFLGNASEHMIIEETDDEQFILIETKKPVIEDVNLKIQSENALRTEKNGSSAVFYCKSDENGKPDIDFMVKASDKDDNYGLAEIKAVFNGVTVFTDTYEENLQLFTTLMEGEKTFNLKTDSLPVADAYNGVITVTDKAGNETVFTVVVNTDDAGPEIDTVEMTTPKSKISNATYYNGNVSVKVIPADAGVGVAEIEWGILDEGNTKKADTVAVKADGTASFTITPSSETVYEEKIYIRAIDKLGNVGQVVEPDKVIIETQPQHNKQSKSHIQVTNKTTSSYKDASGNPLYNGVIESDVQLVIVAEDTYNGIKSIEWTVESEAGSYKDLDGSVEVNSDTLTATGTQGTWNVDAGTDFGTKVTGEITLNAGVVEADDIIVTVTMTDLSGNTSADSIVFSVDNTAPVITVEFDDVSADSEYTNVYKEARTATITVVDRNFGAEQLVLEITNTDGSVPQISDWATTVNPETPNMTTSVAKLVFSEDGDYMVSIGGKDMAGLAAEMIMVEEFTIDMMNPVIKVNYTNENAVNADYYAKTQTAVITIEEHNFAEERIEITGTATLEGADTTFPDLSAWSSDGDTHTATLTFDMDGLYQFQVDYKDKAGREAEQYVGESFYVDMTAPVVEITGVENLSANNGEVIPRISITDSNYNADGIMIELYGVNSGNRTLNGTYSSQVNGQIFTFENFEEKQSNDDIYTVTVTAADMAGNETIDEITFSVNRFGSVYVFDDSLKEIAGMYVQDEIDVRLTEVNVDSLEHDTIRVVVNANGSISDLREGIDYTVAESGGNGEWYQYDYIIDKSLFAGDGRYIVTLYSEDAAGNINENIDESKKAEIRFGIDKTPPVVIPIDIVSEEQYAEDVKKAMVAVNDNLVLQDVQIYVGENQSEYKAEGENYVFEIPSSSDRQDITITAVDVAGNRTNYVISGVLVTTNAFIRWYNNTPLFAGSIAGVAVISGAGACWCILRRSRKMFFAG